MSAGGADHSFPVVRSRNCAEPEERSRRPPAPLHGGQCRGGSDCFWTSSNRSATQPATTNGERRVGWLATEDRWCNASEWLPSESTLLVRYPHVSERAVLTPAFTVLATPWTRAHREARHGLTPLSRRAVLLGGPLLSVRTLSRLRQRPSAPGVEATMPPVDFDRLTTSEDRFFMSRGRAPAGSTPTPVAQKSSRVVVADRHAVDLALDRASIAAGVQGRTRLITGRMVDHLTLHRWGTARAVGRCGARDCGARSVGRFGCSEKSSRGEQSDRPSVSNRPCG